MDNDSMPDKKQSQCIKIVQLQWILQHLLKTLSKTVHQAHLENSTCSLVVCCASVHLFYHRIHWSFNSSWLRGCFCFLTCSLIKEHKLVISQKHQRKNPKKIKIQNHFTIKNLPLRFNCLSFKLFFKWNFVVVLLVSCDVPKHTMDKHG